jgi:hypothetical protein
MAVFKFPYFLLNEIDLHADEQDVRIQFGSIDKLTLSRGHGSTLREIHVMTKDLDTPLLVEFWQGEVHYRFFTKGDTLRFEGLGIPIGLSDHATHIKFSKHVILATLTLTRLMPDRFEVFHQASRYRAKKIWWTIQTGNSLLTNEEDQCNIKMQHDFELHTTDQLYIYVYGDTMAQLRNLPVPDYVRLEGYRVFIPDTKVQHFGDWVARNIPGLHINPESWIPYMYHGEIIQSRGDKSAAFLQKLETIRKEIKTWVAPDIPKPTPIIYTKPKESIKLLRPPRPKLPADFMTLEERLAARQKKKARDEKIKQRKKGWERPQAFESEKYVVIKRR